MYPKVFMGSLSHSSMIEHPLDRISGLDLAQAYKLATEVFKKPYDPNIYTRLRNKGVAMLENDGIEERMDNLKFFADSSHDVVQIWVGIRNNLRNYDAKVIEFERLVKEYLD